MQDAAGDAPDAGSTGSEGNGSTTTGSTMPPPSDAGPAGGTTGSSTDGADGPILTSAVTLDDGDPPVDPPIDPYGPCSQTCTVPGSECMVGACASPCIADPSCPPPLSGNAQPSCNAPYWDYCDLPCDDKTICPDGMQCTPHQYGASCGWP